MSKIEVDKVDPQSGTALEIGTSGDTVTVPSGVGLTLTNSTLLLPTTIQTDKLDPKSGTDLELGSSGDTITIPSGATITNSGTATGFGGGKVLQCISTTKTDTFSTSGNSTFTDVTGLSAAITPSATSSKILVLWNIEIGHSATGNSMLTRLLRDSTAICIGDAASNRQRALTGQTSAYSNTNNTTRGKAGSFLDSPSSTSATTYKLQIFSDGGTVYCNRDGAYDDETYCATGTSTITVMEIGA
jgi:hypothetical protein